MPSTTCWSRSRSSSSQQLEASVPISGQPELHDAHSPAACCSPPSANRFTLTTLAAVCAACLLLLGLVLWSSRQPAASLLIVCGSNRVLVVDSRASDGDAVSVVWSWSPASSAASISTLAYSRFAAIDECKPARAGQLLLITASTGAVLVLDRQSGAVLFQAYARNAHSAELLQDDVLVVAVSTGSEGNALLFYHLDTWYEPFLREELQAAHGVLWDADAQRLYALGYQELREYALLSWQLSTQPCWSLTRSIPFNGTAGHDLQVLLPGADGQLLFTEKYGVWIFDKQSGSLSLHPILQRHREVKSVSVHPISGQLAFVQAEGHHWWAHHVTIQDTAGHRKGSTKTLHFPDINVYKARWMT